MPTMLRRSRFRASCAGLCLVGRWLTYGPPTQHGTGFDGGFQDLLGCG